MDTTTARHLFDTPAMDHALHELAASVRQCDVPGCHEDARHTVGGDAMRETPTLRVCTEHVERYA